MAIDRTFVNGWIDDSGTGVDGTVWNKARINEMLDHIDIALSVNPLAVPFKLLPRLTFAVASSGYNDFAPPSASACIVWQLDTTAMATQITGIAAEGDGTAHLLVNVGGNSITFANAHPSSQAPNRIIVPGYTASFALGPWQGAFLHYMQPLPNCWVLFPW